MSTVRLFVDHPLEQGAEIALERDHAHYLFTVMRLGVGDGVSIFNGVNGEWHAEITETGKKRGTLRATAQSREQTVLPDIELLFAPIKKARTDFIVEKACELGCRSVRPIFTQYTNSERLNHDRLYGHMVEAAEQCGGLSIPRLAEGRKLMDLLGQWDDRALIYCDESRTAPPLETAVASLSRGTPISVLIGPEGGFSAAESERLRGVPSVVPVSLGPRILRADTAAVAALALVQSFLGDWKPKD